MRIKITRSFRDKLNDQVAYIAKDKPFAARKFKSLVLKEIKEIPNLPYKNRKSIFFDREDIRDLLVKGYLVVYKVSKKENAIEVFGFSKWEESSYK